MPFATGPLWYNRLALSRHLLLILALVFFVSSAGCTLTGASSDVLATTTLRPFAPATASPQPSVVPISTVSASTPGPTATPFTHVVQDGETLIYIAYIHGVTLEALLAANPGIDPRFLSIGHELVIPLPGTDDPRDELPLVTPVPVQLAPAMCYRTLSNGLWCLTAARGATAGTIEGLAATITLFDALGDELARRTAYGPLNLLKPQEVMPLAAFFAPPAPEYSHAMAILHTAFEYADEGERYLETDVRLEVMEALPGATRWRLAGSVSLAAGEIGTAERISVLVVGLSANGDIVGFNVWESEGAVTGGERIVVELDLFSLGPPIASVQIMAEAQASH